MLEPSPNCEIYQILKISIFQKMKILKFSYVIYNRSLGSPGPFSTPPLGANFEAIRCANFREIISLFHIGFLRERVSLFAVLAAGRPRGAGC